MKLKNLTIIIFFFYNIIWAFSLQWEQISKINNINKINSFLYIYETNSIITFNNKSINIYNIKNDNSSIIDDLPIGKEIIPTLINDIEDVAINNKDLYVFGSDRLDLITNKKIIQIIKYPYFSITKNLKNNNDDKINNNNNNNSNNNNNNKLYIPLSNNKHGTIKSFKIYKDNIYFIDKKYKRLMVINEKDEIQFTIGKGIIHEPIDFIINSNDDQLFILDNKTNTINLFNSTNGNSLGEISLINENNEIFNGNEIFISTTYEPSHKILYILQNNGLILGFKKSSKGINTFKVIRKLQLPIIDEISIKPINYLKVDIFNSSSIIVASENKIEVYIWIGPLISNIQFIYNRIEISGNGLSNVTLVYFENDPLNPCQDLYIHYDKLISCKYENIKSKLVTNNNYQINLIFNNNSKIKEINGDGSGDEDDIKFLIGNLLFINDGCMENYIYDEINQKCKKLNYNNNSITISKCVNIKESNIFNKTITRIGPCPNSDDWYEISNTSINIELNKIIRFQQCWDEKLIYRFTEIDSIPTFESNSILKNNNCKYSFDEPILIDLQNIINLYQLICFDLYGTRNVIKASSIPMIPYSCNITSPSSSSTTSSLSKTNENQINQVIFLNTFGPWLIGYSRCLHGTRSKDDLDKCQCYTNVTSSDIWIGEQCDKQSCNSKLGYQLIPSTRVCKCNKECNENELLEPISCQCQCKISTPYRCPDSNNCTESFSNCLKSFIQKEEQCDSLSSKPFSCINGKCYSSPSECLSSIPECLYKKCCWNGQPYSTSKSPLSSCKTIPSCPTTSPYRCVDGSCKLSVSQCISKTLLFEQHSQCKLNELCPDGTCPPCSNYDGCSILQPIQCLNGECKNNFTQCQLPSQIFGNSNNSSKPNSNFLKDIQLSSSSSSSTIITPISFLFEPKNNGNLLLPIYIKPIKTIVTIETNIDRKVTVYNKKGEFTAEINLNLPPTQNNKDQTLLSIEPVSDSYLRSVGFSKNLSRENAIYSSVLNITLPFYPTLPNGNFPFTVNITFKMINNFKNLIISKDTINNFCLGFINVKTNQWECVSLNKNNNIDDNLILLSSTSSSSSSSSYNNNNNTNEIIVKGFTNHFTCFAVLLRGSSDYLNFNTNQIKRNENSGEKNQYNNLSFNVSSSVIIGTIFAVIGLAIIVVIIGVIYLSLKKHGSWATMKNVFIERLKYRFSSSSNKNKSTLSPKIIGTIIETKIEKCVGDDDDNYDINDNNQIIVDINNNQNNNENNNNQNNNENNNNQNNQNNYGTTPTNGDDCESFQI
ncbi:hypothetical protein ACTFIU_000443 [Dictyostelium citrinum]